MRLIPHEKLGNVYWLYFEDGKRLVTKSLAPGRTVYGEQEINIESIRYRVWDPFHSKLAAAIFKGLDFLPFSDGSRVLYLGAASGTTASHISDVVGPGGRLYCVEFAQRSIRDLVSNVTPYWQNIVPLFADARFPESYRMMTEKVDCLYCDVAQPEQAKILADNADLFLKPQGWAFLIIKASSVDVTKNPQLVFKDQIEILNKRRLIQKLFIALEPYDKAHSMVLAQFAQ